MELRRLIPLNYTGFELLLTNRMGIVEESTVDDYELPDLVTDNQRQLAVF